VWQCFTLSSVNNARISCNLCNASLARGQKKPLILYAAENDITLPTPHQWSLVERVVSVLAPVERATRDVSAEASLASDVIPMYVAISRAVRVVVDDNGVQTMKKKLLKDIDARFGDITKEPLYAIATLLSADDMDTATERLTDLMAIVDDDAPQPDTVQSNAMDAEPAAQRPCLEEASPLDLLDVELQADTRLHGGR